MTAALLTLLCVAPADGDGEEVVGGAGLPGRFLAVAPGLSSGAVPEGDGAFRALAGRGVRTVICVDGPVPNAAAASRHGLRTVHVPVGYDGIDPAAAAKLAAAVRLFLGDPDDPGEGGGRGGVFVHCHHGKHRGPAAAAVCGRAAGLLDAAGARRVLTVAGTARRYGGLWASVEELDVPAVTAAAGRLSPAELPAAVPPAGLAAAMAAIDARHTAFAAARDEVGDEEEARTLLAEALRESGRLPDLAPALRRELAAAADLAARGPRSAVAASCVDCHTRHRD